MFGLYELFANRSVTIKLALTLALVSAIGTLDYVTGYELSFSVVYLAPVFAGTWTMGRTGGIIASVACAGAWYISDALGGHTYSSTFVHYWEVLIRLSTFTIFALVLAKLRDALRAADERLVTVLEGLDAAVCVGEMKGGDLLYTNQHFRDSFLRTARSANEIDALFEPRPSERFSAARLLDASGTPAGDRQDEFQLTADKRWYQIRARAIRWVDGRIVRLMMATDITEHKRAQELARQQQEKLQITSRLITMGEMATTLAHELNQPLAAISNYNMGCVRRLRSGKFEPQELLTAMEKGSAQAERAGKIIQRVREFVRKREPQLTPCDMNAIVRDVAGMFDIDAETSGVKVLLRLKPELPPVLADKVMIEQVILNLVRNAMEAMQDVPAAGRLLTIRSGLAGPHTIEIAVTDRGRGIPPEMIDNLFTPFFTTKRDGMGMGLHICRSIVEFHDGRLWGDLNSDVGSTFHFTLPAETD